MIDSESWRIGEKVGGDTRSEPIPERPSAVGIAGGIGGSQRNVSMTLRHPKSEFKVSSLRLRRILED